MGNWEHYRWFVVFAFGIALAAPAAAPVAAVVALAFPGAGDTVLVAVAGFPAPGPPVGDEALGVVGVPPSRGGILSLIASKPFASSNEMIL